MKGKEQQEKVGAELKSLHMFHALRDYLWRSHGITPLNCGGEQ